MVLLLLLLLLLLPALAALYLVYRPPPQLIQYLQHRWPDILWQVPTSAKVIALTIDDGPSIYTREILDILKANNATATFFIIGSHVCGREDVLRDIISNGNELGNHAMHDEPSFKLSDCELESQIHAVEQMIHNAYKNVTGPEAESFPKYFRPGSGFVTARMRKLLHQLGYSLVLGGIDPHDPQIPFACVNSAHILSMARPGGIIICHDGRSWSPSMLRAVLPKLRQRGYKIITITELLKSSPP
ncbi:putative polysaccharide deacetylase [Talaromyces proteolyticus]|uniref:chitin deacetylase n=1 Tax=Talaromyces proteolyticus TaxID=1131652 RepID=A0AAD4PT73_9EURO|nr:putative polysaccharide deacetylase [Talaromyces proteolyticus]KAH8690279.1 putative polysaccharide deacetylase [Talaromyces proteolyticus]